MSNKEYEKSAVDKTSVPHLLFDEPEVDTEQSDRIKGSSEEQASKKDEWVTAKITGNSKLNIYNDPKKNGTIFDMSPGDIIEMNQSETENGLVLVRHSGFEGYADKDNLKRI